MDKKTTLINQLNFAALSAWLIASIVMAVMALLLFGQDFRGYYAAARVVIEGGNPYDYHTLVSVLLATTGAMGNNPYYYAPFFAWFIIPLAWLPFNIARIFWMLFNLILWNYSLWQLSNLFKWSQIGWRKWLLYLFVTFLFAWITWRYEQTGIILFALLLGVLLALQDKKYIWAGVWLTLLLIKPNITLIPIIAIVFWLIRHRNWQPIVSMGILTIGLLVIASIITPNLYHPFLETGFGQGLFNTLDGPDKIVAIRINTTLYDWLTMFQVSREVTRAISAIAFLIGLIILGVITWKSDSIILIVVSSLLVNFAITPYALQYDYPPLTLALFWNIAIAQYGKNNGLRYIGIGIIFFIASIPFWERPISDGYWIIIGLIGLTICNWYNADKLKIPSSLL
jgi:hypothetical protein